MSTPTRAQLTPGQQAVSDRLVTMRSVPGPKPLGEPAPAAEALTPDPGLGSRHHAARLNEVIVCDILTDVAARAPDGSARWTYEEIAAAYRLPGSGTVAQIVTRYIWGHVDSRDRQRWVAGLLGTGRQPQEEG